MERDISGFSDEQLAEILEIPKTDASVIEVSRHCGNAVFKITKLLSSEYAVKHKDMFTIGMTVVTKLFEQNKIILKREE